MSRGLLSCAAPVLVGLAVLGLWQFVVTAYDVPVYLVPSPLVVAHTLVQDWALLEAALLTTAIYSEDGMNVIP